MHNDKVKKVAIPFVIVLAVLKAGINFRGYDFYGIPAAKIFPHFYQFYSTSFGDLALAHIFHIYQRWSWMTLHIFLTLTYFIILCRSYLRSKVVVGDKTVFFLLIFSQITTLSLQEIGFYDILMLLGSLIAIANVSKIFKFSFGVILMSSGNPEQSFMALTLLSIISLFIVKSKLIRRNIFIGVFLTISILFVTTFWSQGAGRESYLGSEILRTATKNFILSFPYSILAILGPLSFIIFASKKYLDKKEYLTFLFSVIFIPALLSAIALDGSRVAICVSAAPLIYFLKFLVDEKNFKLDPKDWVFMVLFPPILVWGPGVLSISWQRLFSI